MEACWWWLLAAVVAAVCQLASQRAYWVHLWYLCVGLGMSCLANWIAKGICRQDRLDHDPNDDDADNDETPWDTYGLPSGGAQATAFVATFVWLSTGCAWPGLVGMAGWVWTSRARHSPMQAVAGVVLGALLAWGWHAWARQHMRHRVEAGTLTGTILPKPDDACFLR